MRIQHNILAMNAYRNYVNNTNALSKNLEKLSSGYKINRAGDDAAGLAISEKMRAQITGLDAAQKNVKDGINLVKTAEGAMQEIHDMLNRMDYLATQSANGTYQDPVDRENLQKEVTSLKNEINRIADSSNFNGIKLLDGSQAAGGASDTPPEFNVNLTVNSHDAAKGTYKMKSALTNQTGMEAGDVVELSFNLEDANGNTKAVSMKFTVGAASDGTAKKGLIAEDGTVIDLAAAGTVGAADLDTIADNILSKSKEFEGFDITHATSGQLQFEAKEGGTSTPKITAFEVRQNHSGKFVAVNNGMDETKKAMSKSYTADLNNTAILWDDGKESSLADKTITIGDKKFVFIDKGKVSADTLKYMKDAGIDHYVEVGTAGAIGATDIKAMVEKMNLEGLNVEQGEWDTTNDEWGKDATKTEIIVSSDSLQSGGGLTLQIGDTADSWNQLNVSIGDMHTNAMGAGKTTLDGKEIEVTMTIADIDIGNITGAQDAIGVIKNAINYVSGVRGDLGAIQNRLEHTQNNLSVMQENIQDAESAIRDTDVASEMMAYTKNNILIQSAQAMLAQANAVPQGVLQLLQ